MRTWTLYLAFHVFSACAIYLALSTEPLYLERHAHSVLFNEYQLIISSFAVDES